MEFTYNEFVRYGFGFYNPNHAAALICSIFPFLWNWKRFILIGWAFSAILIAPLYLTYSRTGFVVLFIELIISIFICKYRIRKFFIGVAFLLLATIIASPLGERFALDGSLMNRPKIWLAGLQIFATNPHGVGFGNSGELVSTFLLQNISCRTLVNSHLTLLTEGGIVVSFVCFFFIASAIINGNKKSSSWCAFLA